MAHIKAGPVACAYASKYGFINVDSIMLCIHKYLNVYGTRECLDSGNYILKLLAVLDRRIGKRTVKKLADNIFNEPEWFRKFILLRAESEGIHCRTELDSKTTQNDRKESSAREMEAMILAQEQKAELLIPDDSTATTFDII